MARILGFCVAMVTVLGCSREDSVKPNQLSGLKDGHLFSETCSVHGFGLACSPRIKQSLRFGGLPMGSPDPASPKRGGLMAFDKVLGHNLAITWDTVGKVDNSAEWEQRTMKDRLAQEVRGMAMGEKDFKISGTGGGQIAGHDYQKAAYFYSSNGALAHGITSVWYCKESGRQWMLGLMGDDPKVLQNMSLLYAYSFRCH